MTTASGTASRAVLHLRQTLLDVRNWTRWQSSQRTTSRESTGARVVAMQILRSRQSGANSCQRKSQPIYIVPKTLVTDDEM